MTTPRDDRDLALAGLREFQHEAASLRKALRGYETALNRVCRQVERGDVLHEVMHKVGVTDLRADLVERLTSFETARHRMRVACFRVSLNEGLSMGEVAGLWGISRQLASRMLNEDAGTRFAGRTDRARRSAGPPGTHDFTAVIHETALTLGLDERPRAFSIHVPPHRA